MVTNDPLEPHTQASRHDPIYDELHASPEFAELRRKYQRFIFPVSIAFMLWYLLYVLMSSFAGDFMSRQVVGNINIALVFGLLQFASTFLIAYLYARYANREIDPGARELELRYGRRDGGGVR